MAPVSKCGSCKKAVTKSDLGVECDSCKVWYHAACGNISNELYELMGGNDNLTYNCVSCLSNHSTKKDSLLINKGFDEFSKKFLNLFGNFTAEMRADQQTLKNSIEASIASIRSDLTNSLYDIQRKLDKCNDDIKKVETDNLTKIERLGIENNKLLKRLNRGDVVISGLPAGISSLIVTVLAICAYYDVDADARAIYDCFYVQRGKSVLVKFNNTSVGINF